MTDLMDILYPYAKDHEIAALLARHDGYHESVRCVRAQEKRLRSALEGAGAPLDDLLEEQELSRLFREEACFRAGFQMALELLR